MNERILITTDTFNKDKVPYLLCSAIPTIEPDTIQKREEKYKDVVGLLFQHNNQDFKLYDNEVNTLAKLTRQFNKSIIGLLQCDGRVSAWLFTIKNNELNVIECKASTTNDVNFFVWTEPTPSFWDNADFILNGDNFYDEGEDPFEEIIGRIENLEAAVLSVVDGVDRLGNALRMIVEDTQEPRKENDDQSV